MTKVLKQPTREWKYRDDRATECDDFHFFAANVYGYKYSNDLIDVVDYMKRQGYYFAIWRVALPPETQYEIRNYCPVVDEDKLEYMGAYEPYEKPADPDPVFPQIDIDIDDEELMDEYDYDEFFKILQRYAARAGYPADKWSVTIDKPLSIELFDIEDENNTYE